MRKIHRHLLIIPNQFIMSIKIKKDIIQQQKKSVDSV